MSWAVKLPERNLAVSEITGYRVFEACGFAVPYYGVLDLPDGRVGFGSRIEGGLDSPLAGDPVQLLAELAACAGLLSGMLALDMWLGNEDRHWNNFLWRRNDAMQLTPMIIDFSRAWLVRGWPPQDLRGQACHTTTMIAALRGMGLWRRAAASATLSRVGAIAHTDFAGWLADAPSEWMEPAARAQVQAWWASAQFHQRITDCTTYCA